MITPKTHYYWLDVLRFLAAFLVVACHFRGAFFIEYTQLSPEQQSPLIFAFYSVTRLGTEAVFIFFVLSGLLVGGKAMERLQAGTFNLKDYTIDRSVRIMLPLISALLLYFPVTIFVGGGIDWKSWFGSLFSLQGVFTSTVIEPLWSLSYEVWFYIIMGAFAALIQYTKNLRYRIYSFLILFIAILIFTKLNTTYMFMWFLGAFTLFVIPHKPSWTRLSLSTVFMLACLVLLQITSGSRLSMMPELLPYIPQRGVTELLFALGSCSFIREIIFMVPKNKISILINQYGTRLAAFSYTLYLTHVLVMRVLLHLGVPKSETINALSLSLYIGELALALLVAYGTYWCFEKRTAVVKQWIKAKFPNTNPTQIR